MKLLAKFIAVNKVLIPVLLVAVIYGCKNDLSSLKETAGGLTIASTGGRTITIAGDGTENPNINNPNAVAIGADGTVYFTDQGNNQIKKITGNGKISVVAGDGSQGRADGVAAKASFNNPIGITVDKSDNIYITDFGNNIIRKISPSGMVSTVAGTGEYGFDDGATNIATFNGPTGIVIDSKGNLFVADSHNEIREISAIGIVSTFAGNVHVPPGFADGIGSAANFCLPEGLAIDAADNIYVADYSNNMIRKITPGGTVSTVAGSLTPGFANGPASSATFNGPLCVAVDASGNIYVTDNGNNMVRKISTDGIVSTLAGDGTIGSKNGANLSASFHDLHGIAINSLGLIFVGDEQNNMIRMINTGVTGIN